VVVAVVAVGVVQVAIDEVIDVVAVRHRLMAAAGAVTVAVFVLAALVGNTAARVGRVDRQGVLLDAVGGDVMQVAIVQVIDVAVVLDRRVTAVRAMLVVVVGVLVAHFRAPFGLLLWDYIQFIGKGQLFLSQRNIPILPGVRKVLLVTFEPGSHRTRLGRDLPGWGAGASLVDFSGAEDYAQQVAMVEERS
jgi:hypothetical protein